MNSINYTLKQLRYFVAVAEHGNVSAAARELFISQPAVSSAIAQLEKTFDAGLIIRHHSKGISLTPAGRELLVEARSLLAHAEELSARSIAFTDPGHGDLSLGCFVTLSPFYMPDLIRSLGKRHPGINVVIREGALDTLRELMRSGEVELSLMYDLDLDESFDRIVLAEIPPHVIVSSRHRFRQKKSIALSALAEEPMVLLDLPHSREYFNSLFARLGFHPRIAHRTRSYELVRGLVARGIGFSVLNLQPSRDTTYDGGRVTCLPISDDVAPLRIVLCWMRGMRLSRRAETFVTHCRAHFDAD